MKLIIFILRAEVGQQATTSLHGCGLIHTSARWYDRSYDRPTVAQSLAGRRLSDNGIVSGGGGSGRRVVVDHGGVGARDRPAPSSASSAYLSPATCLSVGSLPTRRHSSIGSTDRRPSNANLIPPSVIAISIYGSIPYPNCNRN